MDIQIEVDADYAFGKEVFGGSPPIPRPGAWATPCEGASLTVREIIERRGEGALITFALLLSIAANISNLVQFAHWLCDRLKAKGKASLRIEGRTVSPDVDEVVEALKELACRSKGS